MRWFCVVTCGFWGKLMNGSCPMLKRMEIILLVMLAVFFCFDIANCEVDPYYSWGKEEFRVVLFVKQEAGSGNTVGSLFTLYDKKGSIIGGAGFLNGFESFKRKNIAVVNFYLKPDKFLSPQQIPPMEVENLGRPFRNATSIYLLTYRNRLIAIDRRSNVTKNNPKYYAKRFKEWRSVAEIGLPWDYNFKYFTPINEGRIDFYRDRVLFNGKVVCRSNNEKMEFFYAGNILYAYDRKSKRLSLYD